MQLRYVEEAVFRWNNRQNRTFGRLALLLGNGVGRHMPYDALIA